MRAFAYVRQREKVCCKLFFFHYSAFYELAPYFLFFCKEAKTQKITFQILLADILSKGHGMETVA